MKNKQPALKYKPSFPGILLQYSEENEYFGGSIREISNIFGVDRVTIYNWMDKYSEFKDVVDKVRDSVNDKVENALLKNALGYTYEEKKLIKDGIESDSNVVQVVIIQKYQSPSTSAQKLWLLNRKGNEWKDKQDVTQSGNITVVFEEGTEELI